MHRLAHCALSKNAAAVARGRHSNSRVVRNAVLVLNRRRMSRTSRLSSTSKNTSTSSSTAAPKKQQKPIHSSAKTEHSTPSMTIEQQQQQQLAQSASSSHTPKPSMKQLKILFTASAVPMIGFGFMDNLVMIQAGQFIDNTIGVKLGLATMTAAAAGQVVSDVSGVIFGGSLERFLHRYKLIKPSALTAAQRALPICRNTALLGAVCGVALGCGLGASCLVFMDLEARERAQKALQLQAVLNDMMNEADGVLHCESCTIHLTHKPTEKHFSTEYNPNDGKTKIDVLPQETSPKSMSLAVQAAHEGHSIMNSNGSVLCTPITQDGEILAVLEFHTKNDAVHGFTTEDEKAAKVMARHIGIFMHRLSD